MKPSPFTPYSDLKLVELGPRLRLRMIKVEEGVCDGRVMWNEYVTKTSAEEKELDQKWEVKRREKEERRKEQRENVERKKLVMISRKDLGPSHDRNLELLNNTNQTPLCSYITGAINNIPPFLCANTPSIMQLHPLPSNLLISPERSSKASNLLA